MTEPILKLRGCSLGICFTEAAVKLVEDILASDINSLEVVSYVNLSFFHYPDHKEQIKRTWVGVNQ